MIAQVTFAKASDMSPSPGFHTAARLSPHWAGVGQRPRHRDLIRTPRHGAAPPRGMAIIMVLAMLAITVSLSYALARRAHVNRVVSTHQDTDAQAQVAAQTATALVLQNITEDPDWMPDPNPYTSTLPSGEQCTVQVEVLEDGKGRRITAVAQVLSPDDQTPAATKTVVVELYKQTADVRPLAAITAFGNNRDWDVKLEPAPVIRGDIRARGRVIVSNGVQLYGSIYRIDDEVSWDRVRLRRLFKYWTPWARKHLAVDLRAFRLHTPRRYGQWLNWLYDASEPADLVPSPVTGQADEDENEAEATAAEHDARQGQGADGGGSAQSSASDSRQNKQAASQYHFLSIGQDRCLHIRDLYLGPTSYNPRGVYYFKGDVVLEDNVSVVGTLMATGTVTLRGRGIRLEALKLRPRAIPFEHEADEDEEIESADGRVDDDDHRPGHSAAVQQVRSAKPLPSASRWLARIHGHGRHRGRRPKWADRPLTPFPVLVAGKDVLIEPTARSLRIHGVIVAKRQFLAAKTGPSGSDQRPSDKRSDEDTKGQGHGTDSNGAVADKNGHEAERGRTEEANGTDPDIYIKGAILAGRVQLQPRPLSSFVLVYEAGITDVTDAPGFFAWKVGQWDSDY